MALPATRRRRGAPVAEMRTARARGTDRGVPEAALTALRYQHADAERDAFRPGHGPGGRSAEARPNPVAGHDDRWVSLDLPFPSGLRQI
jgi:hypothetical protein